ncbi:MAG: hypothetical protein VX777_10055 [Chlamydiota bacterium]|nr:hypothetical protein [Chlamydiota bacterium]
MSNIGINPLKATHIINPFSKSLTRKQKAICGIVSVALGIITLGFVHLVIQLHKLRIASNHKFKVIKNENGKIQHIRNQKGWKTFPETLSTKKDFSYVKPEVELGFLGKANSDLKNKVEERCLGKMRESMKALDPSMVDATRELLRDGQLQRAEETLNNFCNRVMDLYEAYVEVQIDENIPELPIEIGVIKASGFTHDQIVQLQNPCTWYCEHTHNFQKGLLDAGIQREDAETIFEYIVSKGYTWKAPTDNVDSQSDLEKAVSALLNSIDSKEAYVKTIIGLSNQLNENLKSNNKHFKVIKRFNQRIRFAKPLITIKEIEQTKNLIANTNFQNNVKMFNNDSKYRLIQEIRQRFEWREDEPGFVGSPLRLHNIIRCKHDNETDDAHFRAKLFFIYGSKNIMNEVSGSPALVKKINNKLSAKGKNWSIDEKLSKVLQNKSPSEPTYKLGVYARENNLGKKSRHWASPEEARELKEGDENKTFAAYERISREENTNAEELSTRFRFPMYPAEEVRYFGTTSKLEDREINRRRNILDLENGNNSDKVSDTKADTSFTESYLDYMKKVTINPSSTGKHLFCLHGKDKYKSHYLDAIESLGLPQYSGISGSTDQTITIAGLVGIQSLEELYDLRLLYIPWMSGHEDHTTDEILTAMKSFGVPYKPSADYYKDIYPDLASDFIEKVQISQRKKGFELPDYYLSEDYAKIVAEEERLKQSENVQKLLKTNNLILHGTRTYRHNYSLNDPFGDDKFDSYTDFLTDKKIDAVNSKRSQGHNTNSNKIKYELDYKQGIYKEHVSSHLYQGTKKQSLSLVPPQGKIIPYVPFDHPSLNRVGLLFDRNECQIKEDKFVYEYDANVDLNANWKKYYTSEEINSPGFNERVKNEGQQAIEFNRKKAHHVTMEQLIEKNNMNADKFTPYNEINGSIHNKGLVGIYTFSRGLPTYTDKKVQYKDEVEKMDWEPLHHETAAEHRKNEDYDRYMRLMGIGKRLTAIEKFGKDLPLYEINETTNTGLSLISHEDQIELVKLVLANQNDEIYKVACMIKHQSKISSSMRTIETHLVKTLKNYLKKLDPTQQIPKTKDTRKHWKSTGIFLKNKDNPYIVPKDNVKPLKLHKKQMKLLKKMCINDYKQSLSAMEHSVSDACLGQLDDINEPLMDLVNNLTKRYLEMVKGYIATKYSEADQKIQLYKYLKKSYAGGESDPGSIGTNPLAILNLAEGKKDSSMTIEELFNTKMYFLYRLNYLANEIMIDKKLQKGVNEWLNLQNAGWQVDLDLIERTVKKVPFFRKKKPLFWYGKFAIKNYTSGLRKKTTFKEKEILNLTDPNLTFAEGERIAKGDIKNKNELNRRYRTSISPQEQMFHLGELNQSQLASEYRESIAQEYAKNTTAVVSSSNADTSFAETPLEYKKKTTLQPWRPGKHYYNLKIKKRNRYNKVVKLLGLPVHAGVSGTMDQSSTMAGIVGYHKAEDLYKLRMIYLAWMVGKEDHSYHEVMQSSKSYGLSYTPGPASYKDIKPGDAEFVRKLEEKQKERGFELPDYYLSEDYARKKAKELGYID